MLNLESVYQLLKEREKEFNNPLLKTEIQSLYLDAIKYGLDFSVQETELFEKAMLWETQYENTRNIFVVLLLLVLRKKKQQICATLKG